MNLEVTTCNHLGDALCLSAALANLRRVKPDWRVWYAGNYEEIFRGTPWAREMGIRAELSVRCEYRTHGVSDICAEAGSLCDGLTLSLSRSLSIDLEPFCRAPVVRLDDSEREWASSHPASGKILLNTNCQTGSSVKGYPWWSEVCALLPEFQFYLTGGREGRDVRDASAFPPNVTDLRGATTCRELLALASVCSCAVSPPSSLVHAAAAFDKPTVVVAGAREPTMLTDYPHAAHLHSVCLPARHAKRYDLRRGCLHFRTDDPRSCEHPVTINCRNYALCMACIAPETVAEAILRAITSNPSQP
ncbi:MAG: hypothetical protein J5654_06230 [Victivallales bacterium]|nr:hypothetical protein [Victivallales bacterium]